MKDKTIERTDDALNRELYGREVDPRQLQPIGLTPYGWTPQGSITQDTRYIDPQTGYIYVQQPQAVQPETRAIYMRQPQVTQPETRVIYVQQPQAVQPETRVVYVPQPQPTPETRIIYVPQPQPTPETRIIYVPELRGEPQVSIPIIDPLPANNVRGLTAEPCVTAFNCPSPPTLQEICLNEVYIGQLQALLVRLGYTSALYCQDVTGLAAVGIDTSKLRANSIIDAVVQGVFLVESSRPEATLLSRNYPAAPSQQRVIVFDKGVLPAALSGEDTHFAQALSQCVR